MPIDPIKQGDTWPPVATTISDENGPVPLVGATIEFRASQEKGTKLIIGAAVAIDPSNAQASPNVQYTWRQDGTDTDTPGVYRVEWKVTFAPGTPDERQETFPGDGWDQIVIAESLA